MNNDLRSNSLVDMVDYQEEAVVSKTIIEKKTGPDGHFKIPHLWPLQNTPPTSLFHPLKRD